MSVLTWESFIVECKRNNGIMVLLKTLRKTMRHNDATITLFTLAPWPWPSEVLFTLGELYPRQTGQPREDCLGEDLDEGQV